MKETDKEKIIKTPLFVKEPGMGTSSLELFDCVSICREGGKVFDKTECGEIIEDCKEKED